MTDTEILRTVHVWATTQWNIPSHEIAASIIARPVDSFREYVAHVTSPQAAVTVHLKPSGDAYHVFTSYPESIE
jgi:hypothetical protein